MAQSHLVEITSAPPGSRIDLRLRRLLSPADTEALRLLQALLAGGTGLRWPSFARAMVEALATAHYPRRLGDTLTDRIVSLTAKASGKGELGPMSADPEPLVALGAYYVGSIFTFPSRESQQTGPRHRARLQWWLSQMGTPVQGGLDATFSVELSPLKHQAARGLAACAGAPHAAVLAELAARCIEPGHRGEFEAVADRFAAAALAGVPTRRPTAVLGSSVVIASFWALFLLQSDVTSLTVESP